MKRIISTVLAAVTFVAALASCSVNTANENGNDTNNESKSMSGEITVITREESSGTRDAFVELLEITDDDGNAAIYEGAEITEKTSVMLTSVAGNKKAIGYVSLGSLSDDVKAIAVNGVEATAENVKSGDYTVSRNFNLAYKEDSLSDAAADFLKFVLSVEGQKIVEEEGYIAIDTTEHYEASGVSGKFTLAGSTSVGPVAEVLCEAYKELNPDVEFDVQQTGSSAGMTSAIEDACDIGMASRDLKESEAAVLKGTKIATDGIAVVVNLENSTDNLTSEQIKNIFKGDITDWSEIG